MREQSRSIPKIKQIEDSNYLLIKVKSAANSSKLPFIVVNFTILLQRTIFQVKHVIKAFDLRYSSSLRCKSFFPPPRGRTIPLPGMIRTRLVHTLQKFYESVFFASPFLPVYSCNNPPTQPEARWPFLGYNVVAHKLRRRGCEMRLTTWCILEPSSNTSMIINFAPLSFQPLGVSPRTSTGWHLSCSVLLDEVSWCCESKLEHVLENCNLSFRIQIRLPIQTNYSIFIP